jgi:hypothetical protein
MIFQENSAGKDALGRTGMAGEWKDACSACHDEVAWKYRL